MRKNTRTRLCAAIATIALSLVGFVSTAQASPSGQSNKITSASETSETSSDNTDTDTDTDTDADAQIVTITSDGKEQLNSAQLYALQIARYDLHGDSQGTKTATIKTVGEAQEGDTSISVAQTVRNVIASIKDPASTSDPKAHYTVPADADPLEWAQSQSPAIFESILSAQSSHNERLLAGALARQIDHSQSTSDALQSGSQLNSKSNSVRPLNPSATSQNDDGTWQKTASVATPGVYVIVDHSTANPAEPFIIATKPIAGATGIKQLRPSADFTDDDTDTANAQNKQSDEQSKNLAPSDQSAKAPEVSPESARSAGLKAEPASPASTIYPVTETISEGVQNVTLEDGSERQTAAPGVGHVQHAVIKTKIANDGQPWGIELLTDYGITFAVTDISVDDEKNMVDQGGNRYYDFNEPLQGIRVNGKKRDRQIGCEVRSATRSGDHGDIVTPTGQPFHSNVVTGMEYGNGWNIATEIYLSDPRLLGIGSTPQEVTITFDMWTDHHVRYNNADSKRVYERSFSSADPDPVRGIHAARSAVLVHHANQFGSITPLSSLYFEVTDFSFAKVLSDGEPTGGASFTATKTDGTGKVVYLQDGDGNEWRQYWWKWGPNEHRFYATYDDKGNYNRYIFHCMQDGTYTFHEAGAPHGVIATNLPSFTVTIDHTNISQPATISWTDSPSLVEKTYQGPTEPIATVINLLNQTTLPRTGGTGIGMALGLAIALLTGAIFALGAIIIRTHAH